MYSRVGLIADIAAKALLVALLVFGALNPDLAQFAGKAMTGRAIAYPLATMMVPVGWWLFARERPYPFAADLLITAPFLIDTVGNALNLYDSIGWWDDANHFMNWALLTAGFVLLVRWSNLTALVVGLLGIGFGATTAILWELMEYVTFIRNSPELATAYTDTLGDLGLGLAGSVAFLAIRSGGREG
ncbi:MAG: hypothetical protein IH865_01450 [Chloroflexi bacterium]|nr:hypothetical protein [Chloroflexota bacterium]